MSEQFQEIVLQGKSVSSNINLLFLITVICCSVISYKIKNVLKPLIINIILIVLVISFAGNIFEQWWTSLKTAAENLEDKKWLADRDGGLFMIYLSILFKAFAAYLVSIAISILMRKKRQKANDSCPSVKAV